MALAMEKSRTGIQKKSDNEQETEEERYAHTKAMAQFKAEREAQRYNELEEVSTDGIECPKCKNKGMICVIDTAYNNIPSTRYVKCSCSEARMNLRRIKASGLEDELKRCTFENFNTDEPYQKMMLEKVKEFLNDQEPSWLFLGGQVGAGKTHLCTAVCGVLLMERQIPVKYMLWKEESTRLKALINSEDYAEEVNKYKTVPVLYIDDFFKKQRSLDKISIPTEADVNLAFEIINARYLDKSKITIISCEWTLEDLLSFDEATASRIYERAKKHWISIKRDPKFNYRIRREPA